MNREPPPSPSPSPPGIARPDDVPVDRRLSARTAETFWEHYTGSDRRPVPPRTTLAIFVGVPLSGKSTLARALAQEAETRTLQVENDALRARLAAALGHPVPTHDRDENFLTYQTAWRLLALGLEGGANVIHDATSFTEAGRRGAYRVADACDAPVVVVFVETPREVLEARAAAVAPTRQEAYAKLGGKQPDPAACSRPHVILDGGRPVEENLDRLRSDPSFAPFFPDQQYQE